MSPLRALLGAARRLGRRARPDPEWNGSPRVLAIGDWTFPKASQSFVQTELAALAGAGLGVIVAAGARGAERAFTPAGAALAGSVVDLPSDRAAGEAALARFGAARPREVSNLFADLSAWTGLSAGALAADDHLLRGFAFARIAERLGADYLHSYFFYEGALAAFVAQRLLGLPRGLTAYADHRLDDYRLKLVRPQLESADLAVATSRRIRDELLAIAPAAAPSILVKPNTVDPESFAGGRRKDARAAGEPLRLVSVSRFDPKKGLETLVDAVGRLRDDGLAVALDLVGGVEGGDRRAVALEESLRRRVEERRLGAAVRFRGWLAASGVREALSGADLFVAPYRETPEGDKDGLPTAVLEAMAAALPVVAARAGSIDEAIDDGVEGLLVPPEDVEALAGAISSLARDAAARERMGAAAAARVRREFASDRREGELAARIRALVESRRAAGTPT